VSCGGQLPLIPSKRDPLGRWHDEAPFTIILSMKTYTAVVERDPDTGVYVGYVPGFPGAHSQAETLDELNRNLKEVIALLLEDGEPKLEAEFVGIQTVVA
jgi:predicted RNase H-like HicB family nuclease